MTTTRPESPEEYIERAQQRERRFNAFRDVLSVVASIVLIGGLVFWQCNGCSVSDERATEALKNQGFTDIHLGGASLGACAEHESSRDFTATNTNGRSVRGTVCCGVTGYAKGCTIRW